VITLAGSFGWLGLTLAYETVLPLAYWAVGAATLLVAAAWGRFLIQTPPPRLPNFGTPVWEELRQSLPHPGSTEKLLDGLVLASQPLQAQPVRLREMVQASIRRCASPALVHEGGDPYIAGDPAAIAYALDALLNGRTHARIELTVDGRTAEVAVRGTGQFTGLSIIRRLIEAQGGELLAEPDAARIRLPLQT